MIKEDVEVPSSYDPSHTAMTWSDARSVARNAPSSDVFSSSITQFPLVDICDLASNSVVGA